jgi:hypothetical protein
VFPVRYDLDLHILFGRNSKGLKTGKGPAEHHEEISWLNSVRMFRITNMNVCFLIKEFCLWY